MLSDDYEKEQTELRERIAVLTKEICEQEDQADNVDRFIRTVKKYLYLTELTPAILNNLVKAVYVHAPDKSGGHRVQDVDISYNYIAILPASLLNDLIKRNCGMTEIMPHSENNLKLFYWTPPSRGIFFIQPARPKKMAQTYLTNAPKSHTCKFKSFGTACAALLICLLCPYNPFNCPKRAKPTLSRVSFVLFLPSCCFSVLQKINYCFIVNAVPSELASTPPSRVT